MLSVELRLGEGQAVAFEEGARLDVHKASSQVLNPNASVFVDVDVLGEGVQDFSWPLLVDLHCQEVGEFVDGHQVCGWVLQTFHQGLDGQIVALEEELDAGDDGLERIVLLVSLCADLIHEVHV